jgi:hypothetical protein
MDHRLQQCSPHGLQAEMRFRQGYRGRRAPPIFTRERSITHCRLLIARVADRIGKGIRDARVMRCLPT